jgi:hypothetical protein
LWPHQPRRARGVIRTSAPPALLKIGGVGKIGPTDYHIRSHSLVEVAQQGRRFERHEYGLASDTGDQALLVCGGIPGAKDWMLYAPLSPADPLTPKQAGAVGLGQTLNVDGVVAKVSELFQSTALAVETAEADAPNKGDVMYCLAGRAGFYQLLVRWNSYRIEFLKGQPVTEAQVKGAFKARPSSS